MKLKKEIETTKDKLIYLSVYIIMVLLIMLFSFVKCTKKANENATITIVFKYNGKATEQGLVYIKPITSSSYEKNMELDVYGEAVFQEVKPGEYNVLVEKYNYKTRTSVTCDTTVKVTGRSRMNEYKISMNLND